MNIDNKIKEYRSKHKNITFMIWPKKEWKNLVDWLDANGFPAQNYPIRYMGLEHFKE